MATRAEFQASFINDFGLKKHSVSRRANGVLLGGVSGNRRVKQQSVFNAKTNLRSMRFCDIPVCVVHTLSIFKPRP
jgi:hypothetical protein